MSDHDEFDGPSVAPGDSAEQRSAEAFLIARLGESLGVCLEKKEFKLPGGEWLELDGTCQSPLILCEAWAHQGSPKSAQKNKVLADALKLLYMERIASKTARKILLFADKGAARRFQGENWMASALEAFGIEIQVIELPHEIQEAVKKAQKRQNR